MKFDFIAISKTLFNSEEKKNWNLIEEQDKDVNFFIINRKIGRGLLKQAAFFNSKFIDKQSSLDFLFLYFKKKNINFTPAWWWNKTSKKEKVYKNISNDDIKLLLKYNSTLSKEDIHFLILNYNYQVIEEIKKLKKFK